MESNLFTTEKLNKKELLMSVKTMCPANLTKKTLLALGFNENDAKIVHQYRNKIKCLTVENPQSKGFVVNGRQLHKELDNKTPYDMWVKRRIKQLGLVEETTDGGINPILVGKSSIVLEPDFSTFLLGSTGGRPAKEYMFTLSAARQLAMVEKSDAGNISRKFFDLVYRMMEVLSTWKEDRVNASEGIKKINTYLWSNMEQDQAVDATKKINLLINRVVKSKHKGLPMSRVHTIDRDCVPEEVNEMITSVETSIYELLQFGFTYEQIEPMIEARFK